MALFNYASKEITLKVVYYGPGLSGKTTNLKFLHESMSSDKKGKLLSLSTEADRTLFFDFMPISLGKIRDFNIRFQLYTVPGQVRYNATRKLVLKGADAVVFVADSQKAMRDQNIESYQNMIENLVANNINPKEIPVVVQFNKQDLKNLLTDDDLNADLNPEGLYTITKAAAVDGTGVDDTFKVVTGLLLKHISRKHNIKIDSSEDEARADEKPAVAAPPPPPPPPPPAPTPSPPIRDKVSLVSQLDKSEDFAEALQREEEPSEEDLEKSLLETSFHEDSPSDSSDAGGDDIEWGSLLDEEEDKGDDLDVALTAPYGDVGGAPDAGQEEDAAADDGGIDFSAEFGESGGDDDSDVFSFLNKPSEEEKPRADLGAVADEETLPDWDLPAETPEPKAKAEAGEKKAAPPPQPGFAAPSPIPAQSPASLVGEAAGTMGKLETLMQQMAGNTGNMIMVLQDVASGVKNMSAVHKLAEAVMTSNAYLEDIEKALGENKALLEELLKSTKNTEKVIVTVARTLLDQKEKKITQHPPLAK